MSREIAQRLMSFPPAKRLALLLLLYERMIPALFSFRLTEGLDVSVFQEAGEKFWRSLTEGARPVSWGVLRDDILSATPDSEDFGSLEASFALNAALVAADIAGFLEDGQDAHIVEPMQYVLNSLDAYVLDPIEGLIGDKSMNQFVERHPLVQKEKRREEEDVIFLSRMPNVPWSEHAMSKLRHRVENQGSLFDGSRKGSRAGG
jgi:hypothetical protein